MKELIKLHIKLINIVKNNNKSKVLESSYANQFNNKLLFECYEYRSNLISTIHDALYLVLKDETLVNNFMSKEYHGFNLMIRATLIQMNLIKDLKRFFKDMVGKELHLVFKGLKDLLLSRKIGINSYYKRQNFLLNNEVQRATVARALMDFREKGIKTVRWQPQSIEKNTKHDICNDYAKTIFSISDYPEMPHPNCKCLPIAIY